MDVGNGWAGPGYSINKMMLRFRPIAPKPVANTLGSGSTPENILGKRRTNRKYIRVKKNSKGKNKKEEKEKSDGSLVLDDHQTVVTLQLLPESSGGGKTSPEDVRSYPKNINFLVQDRPAIWMNNNILSIGAPDLSDRTSVEMRSPMVVESCVMVDSITNTLIDLSALGSTDMEKMMILESDTCPGLISDGLDSVKWVNLAYRRMIEPLEDGGEQPEMVVRLVVKEKKTVPLLLLPAFACTVRVVYTRNKVKQSRIMPCDVWKMEFGGFAWRFDAKAALSLGR